MTITLRFKLKDNYKGDFKFMLHSIKEVIQNPDDIPDVPQATKEYLQVRYNFAYLDASNHITLMRKSGCSEAHILGFIEGLAYASKVLDEMEYVREQLSTED